MELVVVPSERMKIFIGMLSWDSGLVPGIVLLVLPMVVSLLQRPVEGDEAAEDEDHNHHHQHRDHGPGGLR